MNILRAHAPTWQTSPAAATLALSLAALGALSLGSGDFAFQWQPVPPAVPARATLAMVIGALEVLAGALFAVARLRAVGAWLAAALLVGWTALHVPAVVQRPASIGDWLGIAETTAMASAALMLAAGESGGTRVRAIRRGGMLAFGLSAIIFGVSHLAYADFTASMIPAWLPQRVGLAYFTGAAHALAGLAIASGIQRRLAAMLETVMMASFVGLVHIPRVAAQPGSRMEWTMLFVALLLSGSAGLVARIARER